MSAVKVYAVLGLDKFLGVDLLGVEEQNRVDAAGYGDGAAPWFSVVSHVRLQVSLLLLMMVMMREDI